MMRAGLCPHHFFSTIVEKKLMLSCGFTYILYFDRVEMENAQQVVDYIAKCSYNNYVSNEENHIGKF